MYFNVGSSSLKDSRRAKLDELVSEGAWHQQQLDFSDGLMATLKPAARYEPSSCPPTVEEAVKVTSGCRFDGFPCERKCTKVVSNKMYTSLNEEIH